jgi:hypothetical protein
MSTERERDNAQAQIKYMCKEIALAIGLPVAGPSDTVESVRQLALIRSSKPLGERVRAIVEEQACDDGLWFIAEHVTEAYLQSELRRLHAAIEAEP